MKKTRIVMTDTRGQEYLGNAQAAKGKKTIIKIQGNLGSCDIASIKVIGRHEPTNAERAWDELIHRLLIGQTDLRRSPFIRAVWFPKWKITTLAGAEYESKSEIPPDCTTATANLNDSQKCVVREMVCGAPMVVTHGKCQIFAGICVVQGPCSCLLIQDRLERERRPLYQRHPRFGTSRGKVHGLLRIRMWQSKILPRH